MKKNILIYIISLVIIFQNSTLADIQQFRKDKKPPPTERRQIRPPRPNISNKNKNDRNENSNKDKLRTRKSKQFPLFPDEYTVLDDFSNSNTYNKEIILTTLEHARQKYIQAMILVDKGDTTNASQYFQKSLEILNRISNFPNIEKNNDYIDLAQAIIEDYENFVHSIENLNENSPFFIIRDKLYQEIEKIEPPSTEISRIIIPKDSTKSLIGEKTVITEPKEIVIPLVENEEVLKNIAFLTKKDKKGGKRFYTTWLERTTKWFPMMRRIATEVNAPEELIYLSMIESGLNPNAVSHASAVGLWQFMHSTGQMYGLNDTVSIWIDERRDPEKSTKAALQHLNDLYDYFGDWHLALAAYNCGAGRVQRTIERFGDSTSDYWDIRDKLPKETRHYVPLYIASTKIALNPEAYDFNIDSLDYEAEYTYDLFLLKEPLSLSLIAQCADTTREAITDLNPELIYSITPPDYEIYPIKIPKGTLHKFTLNYSALTPEQKEPWIIHKVQSGESMYTISRKYGVTRQAIADANGFDNPGTGLRRGGTIKIPLDKALYEAKLEKENNKYKVDLPKSNKGNVYHIVKSGESLYSIAGKYGIRMADLRNLNNIPYDEDNIRIGQRLIISKENYSDDNIASHSSNKKLIRHKVKKGENLHSIAENYNVSINQIKNVNNLSSDKILAGQILAIETPAGSGSIASETTQKKTHKVTKGQTLSTIASIYSVTENDLKKWNPNKIKGETIYIGSELTVYEPQTSKGSAKSTPDNINSSPKYYKVRKGDTLYSISRKFGVTIDKLKEINKNLDPENIIAGQKIRIQ